MSKQQLLDRIDLAILNKESVVLRGRDGNRISGRIWERKGDAVDVSGNWLSAEFVATGLR